MIIINIWFQKICYWLAYKGRVYIHEDQSKWGFTQHNNENLSEKFLLKVVIYNWQTICSFDLLVLEEKSIHSNHKEWNTKYIACFCSNFCIKDVIVLRFCKLRFILHLPRIRFICWCLIYFFLLHKKLLIYQWYLMNMYIW